MASKPRAPGAARPVERPVASKAPAKPGAAKKTAVPAHAAPTKTAPSRAAVSGPVRVAPAEVVPGGGKAGAAKATARQPGAPSPGEGAPKESRRPVGGPASRAQPVEEPASEAARQRSSQQTAVPVPVPQQGSRSTAGKPATSSLAAAAAAPVPRPPVPRPAPATAPRDVVAAHEFLLSRSSSRSEAPVTVNGKRLLSEEQLLKMSDADYMNEDQLAFFRHRLQQMEREILSNADSTTEHLRETVIVPDPADRATIEEEHALELRTRDRERKLLKKVQSSIARIDAGDYGYCEETGEPIGIPRLLARPTATLSLEAQQRREMKQKMYGD
jgi:DnaK suppressor protein